MKPHRMLPNLQLPLVRPIFSPLALSSPLPGFGAPSANNDSKNPPSTGFGFGGASKAPTTAAATDPKPTPPASGFGEISSS
jgi:hypothetical protein